MKKINPYSKTHTIKAWVTVIETKFNDVDFISGEQNIAKILSITSNTEIKKIKEALLIVYGRKLGVETFDDACNKLGLSTKLPIITGMDDKTVKKHLAEYQLSVIIKALNQGWYPDWNNPNQYKYFPYFTMVARCGFSSFSTDCYYTNTIVPSALLLYSSALATYCGLKFIGLYQDYLS